MVRTAAQLGIFSLLGMTAIIIASVLAGGAVPMVSAIGNFAQLAVGMGLLALILALWLKAWRAAGAAAMATIVLLAVSAPRSAAPTALAEPERSAKVLFFNVWWANKKLDEVVALIGQADPDVIVFAEVTARVRQQLRTLDARYPYRVECWESDPCDILIVSRRHLDRPMIYTMAEGVQVGVAQSSFDLGGCRVTLFGTHLARPWPFQSLRLAHEQARQASAIAKLIKNWPGATIVVGDFNAAGWTSVTQQIASAANGRVLSGWTGTWPASLPGVFRLPIDHVIVTYPAIQGTREVLSGPGSDHAAVLATLVSPEPSKCQPSEF